MVTGDIKAQTKAVLEKHAVTLKTTGPTGSKLEFPASMFPRRAAWRSQAVELNRLLWPNTYFHETPLVPVLECATAGASRMGGPRPKHGAFALDRNTSHAASATGMAQHSLGV